LLEKRGPVRPAGGARDQITDDLNGTPPRLCKSFDERKMSLNTDYI